MLKPAHVWLAALLSVCVSAVSQTVVRGPYVQQSTENSIIIHWRTSFPSNSKVWYGETFGILKDSVIDTALTNEHIIKISGLEPSSRYYYQIGYNQSAVLNPNSNHHFYTHPVEGSKGHYKFWVIGDAGMGDNNQRAARDAFLGRMNGEKIDGWLWLGDNAYYSGYDSEYQNSIFSNNTYEDIMTHLVAWAAPGNHDYAQNPFNANPDYLGIFDFPVNGEAGGLPSGTEKYFSWNYGNIHFLQLDSYGSDRSYTGAMAQWIDADLQQNNLDWVIAYFHHPPYTRGSHHSDNTGGWDPELPQVREGIVKMLEEKGVDLVLSGHSHCYERSVLIDGHYDYSPTLHDSMIVDSTGGCYPAMCSYKKNESSGKAHKGTVYSVVGVSGKISPVQNDWPHPVMYSAIANELGSMLLEVHENKLKATFINSAGVSRDSFTIVKNMDVRKQVTACIDSVLVLRPTWHESATWLPMNSSGDSLLFFPVSDTVVIAVDQTNCLTDTFEIHVVPAGQCASIGIGETNEFTFSVYPNPAAGEFTVRAEENIAGLQLQLTDLSGKVLLEEKKLSGKEFHLDISRYTNGIYFLRLAHQGSASPRMCKIVISRP